MLRSPEGQGKPCPYEPASMNDGEIATLPLVARNDR